MNNCNAMLQRYYRRIRSYLPCTRKQKQRIMGELHNRIADYLTENLEADLTQIEAHFGKPESIAAAYVDDMDTEELLSALRIRKRITTIIVSTIAIAMLMWTVAVAYATISAYNRQEVFIETIIQEQ